MGVDAQARQFFNDQPHRSRSGVGDKEVGNLLAVEPVNGCSGARNDLVALPDHAV
jgi:hypothetical protein